MGRWDREGPLPGGEPLGQGRVGTALRPAETPTLGCGEARD